MAEEDKQTEHTGKAAIWNKLKNLSDKDKKLLIKLAVCLLAGILLMSMAGAKTTHKQETTALPSQANAENYAQQEAALEEKLVNILSQIDGAGTVSAAVTLAEGTEAVYATDNDNRQDEQELQSKISLTEINNEPVLVKERLPRVQGAVIVAEGAADPLVKERLYQAAVSLLGLNYSQVAVIEKQPAQ